MNEHVRSFTLLDHSTRLSDVMRRTAIGVGGSVGYITSAWIWISMSPMLYFTAALVGRQQSIHLSIDAPKGEQRQRRLEKGVAKIFAKFKEWSQSEGEDAILWVDGNNLRGMGKFEWTPLELHHHVVAFCREWNIPQAVVVWDHGRVPSACISKYDFGGTSLDDFSLDLVILFSGLSQRADDVLLKESQQLASLSGAPLSKWKSMAFVTSDRELNYKLRRQASSTTRHLSVVEDPLPLFCDSTRFMELLRQSKVNPSMMERTATDKIIRQTLVEVKESIVEFHKDRRRGYNPRREKTWERAVVAETLRWCLYLQDTERTSSPQQGSPRMSNNRTLFVDTFVNELQSRGYKMTMDGSMGDDMPDDIEGLLHGPFQGPTRLDKQQRRSLNRYNRFLLHKLHPKAQQQQQQAT